MTLNAPDVGSQDPSACFLCLNIMIMQSEHDYSCLDKPEISFRLFHPRPEYGAGTKPENSIDLSIPTDEDIVLGGRFHLTDKTVPNILFFHGNGEIAEDYDDLGPVFHSIGMNFLPVDYRGYGRSTGTPTVGGMMRDSHVIYKFTKAWLQQNNYTGSFIIMGRSLGSASALELANHYKSGIDALIIESGFALTGPLLELLGVNTSEMGFTEEKGLRNIEKIKTWDKPALIIHAEFDHLIPFSDGQALYDTCASSDKTLLKIPGANHNDIFSKGLDIYLSAIKDLCGKNS
jgi:uncharacterized protein